MTRAKRYNAVPSKPSRARELGGYDHDAEKQTVSLTVNSDLYRQAKQAGINASQIAESALAAELARRRTEQVKDEIRQDLEHYNAYVAKYGSFAELARQHYQARDDDE